MHKILEKIKHEPYFRWPSKVGGDSTESSKCVQNTLERLDPQFTNYQFKLIIKKLMCGI